MSGNKTPEAPGCYCFQVVFLRSPDSLSRSWLTFQSQQWTELPRGGLSRLTSLQGSKNSQISQNWFRINPRERNHLFLKIQNIIQSINCFPPLLTHITPSHWSNASSCAGRVKGGYISPVHTSGPLHSETSSEWLPTIKGMPSLNYKYNSPSQRFVIELFITTSICCFSELLNILLEMSSLLQNQIFIRYKDLLRNSCELTISTKTLIIIDWLDGQRYQETQKTITMAICL